MDPFLQYTLIFGLGATLAGSLIWYSIHSKKRWRERLAEAASALQIDYVAPRFFSGAIAAGEVRGCTVEIDTYSQSAGKSSTLFSRIVVDAGLPESLTIKRQGMIGLLAQRFLGADVQAGLAAFDDAFILKEEPKVALLGRLSARSRRAIWECVAQNKIEIEAGKIRMVHQGYIETTAKILSTVSLMLELGEALQEFRVDSSTAAGLLHHAFEDPEPAFRRRCFGALLDHFSGTPEAEEALRRGAASEDPALLFLIERHKPEPNLDVIAGLVRGGRLPASLKTEGLAMLGPRYAGGLSVEAEGAEGSLALADGTEGALSPAEPARARPKKQSQ